MPEKSDLPSQILDRVIATIRKKEEIGPLNKSETLHVVQRADSFGVGKPIEGTILVETSDGTIHRLSGAELSILNEKYPEFLKQWRL